MHVAITMSEAAWTSGKGRLGSEGPENRGGNREGDKWGVGRGEGLLGGGGG